MLVSGCELYLARSWTTSETQSSDLVPSTIERNTTAYGFSAGVVAFVF